MKRPLRPLHAARTTRLIGATPHGFTLLEVLVVLSLFGLLVVGLLQGTRFALFAVDDLSRSATRHADFDSVQRTLRHLIATIRPGSDWEPTEFVGSAHSAAFTSLLPVGTTGRPDMRADVGLAVDDHRRLVLAWTPHLHAVRTRPAPAPVDTVLLTQVASFDLSYWPAPDGGWTSVWHDLNPPRLIRIHIVPEDSTPGDWSDLLIAPMLDPL